MNLEFGPDAPFLLRAIASTALGLAPLMLTAFWIVRVRLPRKLSLKGLAW